MDKVVCSRDYLMRILSAETGKLKYFEKKLSFCHFVHHKSHTAWTGKKPTTLR